MSAAFQGSAFQFNAFEALTGPAFEADAFQGTPLAFQLAAAPSGVGLTITSMSMLTDPIDAGNVGVLPECV